MRLLPRLGPPVSAAALWVNAIVTAAIADAAARARRRGNGGKATVDPAADETLTDAQNRLDHAQATVRDTPSHLPLAQVRPRFPRP